MACKINSGILSSASCEYLIGGVQTIYLANKEDITSFAATGGGALDTITMSGTAGFYQFDVAKNTSSYECTLVVSGSNKYFNHIVNATISSAGYTTFEIAETLGIGKFVAIVKTKNGKMYVLGKGNGLEASALTANSGVNAGDSAGLVVTLSGEELNIVEEFIGTIPMA